MQYYVREAPHYFGMWRANMSNILLSWTYTKAIARAALGTKSGFATHTAAEDAPADDIMPNPPMPDKQEDSELLLLLAFPTGSCCWGHCMHHAVWLAVCRVGHHGTCSHAPSYVLQSR